jgi:hypothetical protein
MFTLLEEPQTRAHSLLSRLVFSALDTLADESGNPPEIRKALGSSC